MGIDINRTKQVFYNAAHNKLVDTCIDHNPTIQKIDSISIYSIFKRMRSKEQVGDGNPLIYALKNKNGFTIHRHEIKKFLHNMDIIIDKVLNHNSYDLLLIPPSQHRISSFLAKRINKKLNIAYCDNLFCKKTIMEVVNETNPSSIQNESHKKEVKSVLANLKKSKLHYFTMKEINNKLRTYFDPIKINPNSTLNLNNYNNILIIDDLLSTGNTIVKTHKIIIAKNSNANVEGMCLLSALVGK